MDIPAVRGTSLCPESGNIARVTSVRRHCPNHRQSLPMHQARPGASRKAMEEAAQMQEKKTTAAHIAEFLSRAACPDTADTGTRRLIASLR